MYPLAKNLAPKGHLTTYQTEGERGQTVALDNLKKTELKGVYYLEHSKRRYGVARKERQFVLRYTINGRTCKEVFGWESDGATAEAASLKIKELKANAQKGEGPVSFAEEKALDRAKRDRLKAEAERQQQAEQARNLTFGGYFNGDYLAAAKVNKTGHSVETEESLYNNWLKLIFADVPIRDIKPWHFEQLKAAMKKAGRSARTIHYAVAVVTQAWNAAFDNGKVDIQPPRRKTLKLPMIDNERTRAFTPEQAVKYFQAMRKHSPQWFYITKVSLFAGLRASEVFRLKVENFNEEKGKLFLVTPKKQRSQEIVLNDRALRTFKILKAKHPTKKGLFFTNSKGGKINEVSNSVQRVIDGLGFNKDITDRRDRLTFHSWRHTHATWLHNQGVDIYTVSKLLRHSSLAMTKKYTHPDEDRLRAAANVLDKVKTKQPEEKKAGAEAG